MQIMNVNYPQLEDVEQMTIMELKRGYRFLPVPETEAECAVLNAIGDRIDASGVATRPLRMDRGLDTPETLGVTQDPYHGS